MEKTQVLQLKVAQAVQQDVGKGLIRIGTKHSQALHLGQGDLVELQGARLTAAIPVPGYAEDEALDIVRLDGLVRGNAGVGLGDPVKVKKAAWKEAKKVTLAPAKAGFRIAGSGEGLKPTLLFRPLVQGDLVSTTVFNRPQETFPSEQFSEEFFRGFFESPAFGLMEIRLVVTATVPAGIVRVTEGTQIQLASEYQEVTDRQFHHVTYDDLGGMKEAVQKVREMIELPLKHPELFDRLGIDAPKGVLLHGPPGTGKTLMVKAVAQEAQAYFTAINGPEIMGKMYGESEQRLREIFDEAEKNAPAIVFIDELDSIAPKRAEVTGEVPGRFDREIELRIPDQSGRLEILQIHTRGMPLSKDVVLEKLAALTLGYSGSDLAALAREAALATLRRVMPIWNLPDKSIPPDVLEKLTVNREDFEQALKEVQPSALREIVVEIPKVRWEDVGGLKEVRQTLYEMVEIPLKKPETFRRLGIRPPKGLLLYGAPGTGKTLVAKAVANQAGANFLVAKGSSLLSKWYGESEKKIAEFFRRARQVAPAVLFFDELDSLAPIRGRALGEPQVTERVVNQLLAEMDGLEELQGVFVLGATNRLDMIEPALLRPGRFDQIVYVPVPDQEARLEIFRAHTKGMALDPSVSIERLAELAIRFTGADIAGVCLKAGLYALRENLSAQTVTVEHFLRAIKDTIPSVTEEAEQEYQKLAQTFKQDSHRIGFRK
ncbi:MAG: AAA family ATPase [Nitrospirae bacterium]|nr:MAG: AAA family ATPase [Nitrospirota bacterium]